MKELELLNQSTFRKYEDNIWFDGLFEFKLIFQTNYCSMFLHNETNGSTWYLKNIKDIKDLKKVYESITNKKFK